MAAVLSSSTGLYFWSGSFHPIEESDKEVACLERSSETEKTETEVPPEEEQETPKEEQEPPEEEQAKTNELHYATIDFGFTESKKIPDMTEATTYAIIRTDGKEDTDDYDVVLIK